MLASNIRVQVTVRGLPCLGQTCLGQLHRTDSVTIAHSVEHFLRAGSQQRPTMPGFRLQGGPCTNKPRARRITGYAAGENKGWVS
jgi:hypothetical protein